MNTSGRFGRSVASAFRRTRSQRMRLTLAIVVGAAALRCDQPLMPIWEPPPTVPPNLSGNYALTVEFPASCETTAALTAPRTYAARLQFHGGYVHSVYVTGGGYVGETPVGNLSFGLAPSWHLQWNTFDFGCDGTPEPMPEGRALIVCGEGSVTFDSGTIRSELPARTYVDADGTRQLACEGLHRLSFVRSPGGQ
jgi:hypothetical protein